MGCRVASYLVQAFSKSLARARNPALCWQWYERTHDYLHVCEKVCHNVFFLPNGSRQFMEVATVMSMLGIQPLLCYHNRCCALPTPFLSTSHVSRVGEIDTLQWLVRL